MLGLLMGDRHSIVRWTLARQRRSPWQPSISAIVRNFSFNVLGNVLNRDDADDSRTGCFRSVEEVHRIVERKQHAP
jgi:hypothetical protein